jgi:cellulose synthase (UDP-forming)
LDDGARDWVEALANELGAFYVRRVKGKDAKAGNVNNGLAHALNTGRPPEFVLLLDADFCADRTILKRTLGLFNEPDVGIVQTPQHFFNQDPVQANLLCGGVWPDEQRFFFSELLPCKDAWGAAFCCGTSAVVRVAALVEAGGMATETVTEDMLTSFKIEEYGWRTIFLNEVLSLGLAPEGLQQYLTQRGRWCLGAIQQIYTRWSFFGPARVQLINRLSSLDGVMYWMFTFAFRMMMISAPMIYWWTGTSVVVGSLDDIIYWVAPMVLTSIAFMVLFASARVLPIMTDVTQMLSIFVVIRTVAGGLVKPFGRPFKVTAKGVQYDRITVQWRLMLPLLCVAAATGLGIVVNLPWYTTLRGQPGYQINVFWSIFNIAVLLLAAAVCVELPRRRKDERFVVNEPAIVEFNAGEIAACRVYDISLGGARLLPAENLDLNPAELATLVLDGGRLRVPFTGLRVVDGKTSIQFIGTTARRALIAKIFTGAYHNEVPRIVIRKVMGSILSRLLR